MFWMRGFYEVLSHSSLPTVDCSSHMTKLTSMETKTMHCLGHSEQQQTQSCVIDSFHLLKKCMKTLWWCSTKHIVVYCSFNLHSSLQSDILTSKLKNCGSLRALCMDLFVSNCLFLLFPLFALPLSACSSSIYKLGSYDRTQVLL